MAEIFGVVTGVLGLLPLCRDGFIMIKDMVQVEQSLADQLRRIETHYGHFVSWYEIWGDGPRRETKLREYEEAHPVSVKAILRQLALFSRLFYDLRALEKYGFKVEVQSNSSVRDLAGFHFESDEDLGRQKVEAFRASCVANLSVVKKIKFVMWSRDKKLDGLISRLREYNEVLWRYGPRAELARLDKGVYDQIGRVVANELKVFFEMYTREAETATDPASASKYRSLAMMANFRSQVRQEDTQSVNARPRTFPSNQFRIEGSYRVESRGMSTMALLYDYPRPTERKVVLIEWVQNPQLLTVKVEAGNLASLLSTPKPDKMLVPSCLGVIDDRDRLGVVMAIPPNVGDQIPPQLHPGSISYRRMPVSLRSLITNTQAYCSGLNLGIRFNVAKQLADTVHMMHAVEWVHKNIRPDSVLFFPEGAVKNEPYNSGWEIPKKFDFNRPLLFGFSHARSDYQPPAAVGGFGDYDFDPASQTAARNLTLDYYQHPAKRENPSLAYRRMYDLYSLGCVLLEIGLWETLDRYNDIGGGNQPPYAVMRLICSLASGSRLDANMGSIYGGVVRDCLNLGGRTSLDDPARFGTDIASRLSQCVA